MINIVVGSVCFVLGFGSGLVFKFLIDNRKQTIKSVSVNQADSTVGRDQIGLSTKSGK